MVGMESVTRHNGMPCSRSLCERPLKMAPRSSLSRPRLSVHSTKSVMGPMSRSGGRWSSRLYRPGRRADCDLSDSHAFRVVERPVVAVAGDACLPRQSFRQRRRGKATQMLDDAAVVAAEIGLIPDIDRGDVKPAVVEAHAAGMMDR